MNLLAEIYSGGNKLKRLLGDFVADPIGNIQQGIGYANDRAGTLNRLTALAAQEHVNSITNGGGMGANQNKLAQLLADSYNPAGMVVWHGSPHKFSKFDSSKIGTGEGAQAYGHGLYLAESDEVAKGYQQATSKDRFITSDGYFDPSQLEHLNVRAATRKGDLQNAIDVARKYAEPDPDYPEVAAKAARDLAILERLKATGGITQNTGSLYKVDLPDDAIAKMLDWDKPLSQQAPEVQSALQNSGLMKYADDYFKTNRKGAPTGADLHDFLKYSGYDQGELAAKMAEQGLPGIRYLDGGSRGAGSGTSNFVVFPGNEGLLTILERNGQPLK